MNKYRKKEKNQNQKHQAYEDPAFLTNIWENANVSQTQTKALNKLSKINKWKSLTAPNDDHVPAHSKDWGSAGRQLSSKAYSAYVRTLKSMMLITNKIKQEMVSYSLLSIKQRLDPNSIYTIFITLYILISLLGMEIEKKYKLTA